MDTSEEPVAVYRQSVKASLGQIVFASLFVGLWGGIFLGLFVGMALAGMGYSVNNVVVFVLVGIGVAAAVMVVQYLRIRSIKYEIFEDTIRKTDGIVTTNYEEMNASRIDDVEYRETVFHGMFGTGSVSIQAEGSDDEFTISHIEEGRSVYERFRGAI